MFAASFCDDKFYIGFSRFFSSPRQSHSVAGFFLSLHIVVAILVMHSHFFCSHVAWLFAHSHNLPLHTVTFIQRHPIYTYHTFSPMPLPSHSIYYKRLVARSVGRFQLTLFACNVCVLFICMRMQNKLCLYAECNLCIGRVRDRKRWQMKKNGRKKRTEKKPFKNTEQTHSTNDNCIQKPLEQMNEWWETQKTIYIYT